MAKINLYYPYLMENSVQPEWSFKEIHLSKFTNKKS